MCGCFVFVLQTQVVDDKFSARYLATASAVTDDENSTRLLFASSSSSSLLGEFDNLQEK